MGFNTRGYPGFIRWMYSDESFGYEGIEDITNDRVTCRHFFINIISFNNNFPTFIVGFLGSFVQFSSLLGET